MSHRDFYIDRLRSAMTAFGILACTATWLLADPLVRLPRVRRIV